MWGTFLFLLIGGGIMAWINQGNRERLRGWQEAVVSCGLQVVKTSSALSPELKASAGPVKLRMEACGDQGRLTRILVDAPVPWQGFRNVAIRPEPLIKWAREIEIGDESFDKTFFIEGPPRLVFAALDAETRRLLGRAKAEGRLEISFGQLRADIPDEKVGEVLPLLLDLSRRFARPLDVSRRLAENAEQDSEPGVRLQNLLLLIRELPKAPATAEALHKACSDPAPEIRLRAAQKLGAEGRGVLLELAESLEEDEVSAEAVSLLDRELQFELARSILVHALSLRRNRTARACLGVLGRGGADAVDALAPVVASKDIELAAAAAEALGATGSPAAEAPLIAALRREQTALQAAAANALGRVGSVAAVLPLKEAGEHAWLDPRLRRALRQAVAEIQLRVQGASPGQLSLAGADAGQLSLADDPAGRLSISGDESPDAPPIRVR